MQQNKPTKIAFNNIEETLFYWAPSKISMTKFVTSGNI